MEDCSWENVPDKDNIIYARLILSLNDYGPDKKNLGSKINTVQEQREKVMTNLVHNTSVSRQFSTKTPIGLAFVFGFIL